MVPVQPRRPKPRLRQYHWKPRRKSAATSGTYCVVIQGTGNTASPLGYQVKLTGAMDAPVAASGLGAELSGGVFAGATNSSTFTGSEGLAIYFDSLDRGGNSLVVDVRDPIGMLVFSIGQTADAGPFVLPRSGTYTVNVRGSSPTATGLFRFRILDLSAAPPIALNTSISGTLSPGYKTDVYQLNASAGQRLLYDALESDSERTLPRLLSPNGTFPFGGNLASRDVGPFTHPVSETHYFIVEGDQSSDNGYN